MRLCLKSTCFPLVLEAGRCSAPAPLATLACRQWECHPLAHTKSTGSSRSHGTAARLWHCRGHCKRWKSLSCLLQAWCWLCLCARLARPRRAEKGQSSTGASAGRWGRASLPKAAPGITSRERGVLLGASKADSKALTSPPWAAPECSWRTCSLLTMPYSGKHTAVHPIHSQLNTHPIAVLPAAPNLGETSEGWTEFL